MSEQVKKEKVFISVTVVTVPLSLTGEQGIGVQPAGKAFTLEKLRHSAQLPHILWAGLLHANLEWLTLPPEQPTSKRQHAGRDAFSGHVD